MPNLPTGFNANEHEPMDFDLLPPGWHRVCVVASEMKTAQKANPNGSKNQYIALTIKVVDGPAKGRQLWENLNFWNQNQEAVKMANRTFASICRSVGVQAPNQTEEIHNMPFGIKIGHKKDSQGEMRERIQAYCTDRELPEKISTNPAPSNPAAQKPMWATPPVQGMTAPTGTFTGQYEQPPRPAPPPFPSEQQAGIPQAGAQMPPPEGIDDIPFAPYL